MSNEAHQQIAEFKIKMALVFFVLIKFVYILVFLAWTLS